MTSCDIDGVPDNASGKYVVKINTEDMVLAPGETASRPSTNATATTTYTSSDPAVATVDNAGLVKAVAEGTCVITVSTPFLATKTIEGSEILSTATAEYKVIVAKKAGSISYAEAAINKEPGDAAFTNKLTVVGDGKVTFESSDAAVATVDAEGKVTIIDEGTATITATVEDSETYKYETNTASYTLTVAKMVIMYSFKVTDLAGVDQTNAVTSLKMSKADGTLVAEAEVSGGKITITNTKLTEAGITAAADFWFEAEIGGKPYIAKVNINPTTLSPESDKTLAMATVGDVITSDGTFATKGAAGEQAVLAYIGKVDNYFDRFLAIALEDADAERKNWSDALTKAGEYAAAHAITIGGTTYNTGTTGSTRYGQVTDNGSTSSATATALQQGWRLPSVTDWRYIFAGLCGLASPAPDAGGVYDGMSYGTGSTLHAAINTACGNSSLIYETIGEWSDTRGYWSSSDHDTDSSHAWYYRFIDSLFCWSANKTTTKRVRAVFAY